MSNLLAAFAQTLVNVAHAMPPAASSGGKPKSKKKGAGCTPCAVAARVRDAQARAGLNTGEP